MPRVVRVCDECWFAWMYNEARYMTISDVLRQIYFPSNESLAYNMRGINNGRSLTIRDFRRERWLRRSSIEITDQEKWPSKVVADAIQFSLLGITNVNAIFRTYYGPLSSIRKLTPSGQRLKKRMNELRHKTPKNSRQQSISSSSGPVASTLLLNV